ncbi:hypothetical protein [Clostridium culturomicium]|uniref:hypothetical protein n=1 Tax=Clostridium culturomicium TaxID=1499683 RepID=UPI00058E42F7|nr:hypothetical protein [Clostridium culturomicium]
MLSGREMQKLKKYSFGKSDLLLKIGEDIKGQFYIRPIRWSGSYKGDKLKEGECLARFDTREDAEDALINICGYSKKYVASLSS